MMVIMFLAFAVLMIIGFPIAFAMGSASLLFKQVNDISLAVAAKKFFSNTHSFWRETLWWNQGLPRS